MTFHLFLDDERMPWHVTWVSIPDVPYQIVRDYEQFVATIENHGIPKFVTYDHDLSPEHYIVMNQEVTAYEYDDGNLKKTFHYGAEPTGFECCKWFVNYCHENKLAHPPYEVHSLNPVGAERIRQYIETAKREGFIT